MKQTGKYEPSEDQFDIDHEITEKVNDAKIDILDLKSEYPDHEEYRAVVKAIISEYLDSL